MGRLRTASNLPSRPSVISRAPLRAANLMISSDRNHSSRAADVQAAVAAEWTHVFRRCEPEADPGRTIDGNCHRETAGAGVLAVAACLERRNRPGRSARCGPAGRLGILFAAGDLKTARRRSQDGTSFLSGELGAGAARLRWGRERM
jgi:hypothetical protein